VPHHKLTFSIDSTNLEGENYICSTKFFHIFIHFPQILYHGEKTWFLTMAQLKLGTYLLCLKCLQWLGGENFETRIEWVDILSWTFNHLNLHKWTRIEWVDILSWTFNHLYLHKWTIKDDYCSFKHHIFRMFIQIHKTWNQTNLLKHPLYIFVIFYFIIHNGKSYIPRFFP
jgi:hypothetical protein